MIIRCDQFHPDPIYPHNSSVSSKVRKMRNLRRIFDKFNKVMKLGLVKSCWIGSKTL